ncbi:kinase-like domain-containing protein [Multifurca ochricompacta]|uniref:Kinase-like domain-containing protein n=1 Tax=Multifurca ochricompacta TaxID=376703 RepID=A0AAD4QMU9_9AGAM|nr:kinase-like domain-containing protein [Multifurca ochricompacta]
MEAFKFVFQLYNLLSRVIEDNARLDWPTLSLVLQLADYISYDDYPSLTTDKGNGSKSRAGGSKGTKGDTKQPETIFEEKLMRQTLEHAGYQITQQEDERVVAQLTSRMRTASSSDGAPVVLKLLDDDTDNDGMDELKILRYLSRFKVPSNHAIELHGVVDLTIGKAIALPWRTPLVDYLQSQHPLLSAESLQRQLLEGVAFLHEHKIAHLDLKPDNVVIDSERDRYCPRLSIIDFGLSVVVEDEETMIEGYCGTRRWTAPEVGTSDDSDTKYSPILADRWACGRMLGYLEAQVPNQNVLDGDDSWGILGRLWKQLLNSDPRSRPSLSVVLDEYQRYQRDRMVERGGGEDDSDAVQKRIGFNCADDIVNEPNLSRIEIDDGFIGHWIACS